MIRVCDVAEALFRLAPEEMKMDFDNVGFLVGQSQAPAGRILVSLDITDEVVVEAARTGMQLIVSHHPLFFSLTRVTDEDRIGRKIVSLLAAGISAVCMHTNLDAARGGVNDALARAAGLLEPQLLAADGTCGDGTPYSYGRVGMIGAPCSLKDYMARLAPALGTRGLRYHDAGKPVHRVAVVGGSGGSELSKAILQGCDTLVTADVKYDVFLEAKECGINLIDGDHFCTENLVVPKLAEYLGMMFPGADIQISETHGQTARFYMP